MSPLYAGGTVLETLTMERIDPRELKDGVRPVEGLIQIILYLKKPNRLVSIGSLLESEIRGKLT